MRPGRRGCFRALTPSALCDNNTFAETETANKTEPDCGEGSSERRINGTEHYCPDDRPGEQCATDGRWKPKCDILRSNRSDSSSPHENQQADKNRLVNSCVNVGLVGRSLCRNREKQEYSSPATKQGSHVTRSVAKIHVLAILRYVNLKLRIVTTAWISRVNPPTADRADRSQPQ